jgi:uncharacterized protein (DUF433 family)
MVAQKRTNKYVEMRAGASGIPLPRIKGSRIRVSHLAQHYTDVTGEGMTHDQAIDDMVRAYPTLTRAEVKGGIEYWRAHEEDIEREMKEDELVDLALEAQQKSLMKLLSRE